jgi:nitronate monooxygenase
MTGPRERAAGFCRRYGLGAPVLEAPMAGACPVELAVAVAGAGGMGANGVVLDPPERIEEWVRRYRESTDGPLQLNTWIPDPPVDDQDRVAAAEGFLSRFGEPAGPGRAAPVFRRAVRRDAGRRPTAVSSIMGLFGPTTSARCTSTASPGSPAPPPWTTPSPRRRPQRTRSVAQGMEAGGHRGTFDPDAAEATTVGLFALRPPLRRRAAWYR